MAERLNYQCKFEKYKEELDQIAASFPQASGTGASGV